jgi:hypothetical protein
MENVIFKWERCRDGYTLAKDEHGTEIIRPNSRTFYAVEPLVVDLALFRRFALLKKNPRAYVEFASTFGLLKHARDEEPIATWNTERSSLHAGVSLWEAGRVDALEGHFNSLPFAKLDVRVRDGVLSLEPRNLRDAIWLQLALSLTKREKHKACLWCKTWFPYGPGTGRRETALYCSPRCQKAQAYQKTKNGPDIKQGSISP